MNTRVLCPASPQMSFLSFLFLTASQPSISDESFPGASETDYFLLHNNFLTLLSFLWPILNIPRSTGRPGCCLPHFRFPQLNEQPEAPNRASHRGCQAKV